MSVDFMRPPDMSDEDMLVLEGEIYLLAQRVPTNRAVVALLKFAEGLAHQGENAHGVGRTNTAFLNGVVNEARDILKIELEENYKRQRGNRGDE